MKKAKGKKEIRLKRGKRTVVPAGTWLGGFRNGYVVIHQNPAELRGTDVCRSS